MLYKRIGYFLEAARCLNFTEAAKRCFISQQAMTWHISSLEEELGVKLFIRTTRSVQLTETGIYLRDQFSRINDDISLCINQAQSIGKTNRSTIKVGIYESFSHKTIILPVMQILTQTWPDIYFDFQLLGLGELRNRLLDNKLDLIITTSYTWRSWGMVHSIVLRRYPFKAVLASDHPLVSTEFVLSSLADLTLLTNEQPSQYNSEISIKNMPLWRQQLPRKDYLHLPDMTTLLVYLKMHRGFAYLTEELEGLSDTSQFCFYDLPFADACSDTICCYADGENNALLRRMAKAVQGIFK